MFYGCFNYEYKVPEEEIVNLADIMVLCCHEFGYGRKDGITTIRTQTAGC